MHSPSFPRSEATLATSLTEPLQLGLGLLFLLDERFHLRVGNEVDVVHELVLHGGALLALSLVHARLEESLLTGLFDLIDSLHGLQGLDHEVSVIARRDIALLLELKDRVVGHFLAVRHAVGLGPLELARILLCLEQLVALGRAEAEKLGVVSDEGGAAAGIHVAATEVALINSHFILYLTTD